MQGMPVEDEGGASCTGEYDFVVTVPATRNEAAGCVDRWLPGIIRVSPFASVKSVKATIAVTISGVASGGPSIASR